MHESKIYHKLLDTKPAALAQKALGYKLLKAGKMLYACPFYVVPWQMREYWAKIPLIWPTR